MYIIYKTTLFRCVVIEPTSITNVLQCHKHAGMKHEERLFVFNNYYIPPEQSEETV